MKEKKGIIFAFFGTQYFESEQSGLYKLEQCIIQQYPTAFFQRALIGQRFLDFWKERGIQVASLDEALCHCKDMGIGRVEIFAANVAYGREYACIQKTVKSYASLFEQVFLSLPLLGTDENIQRVLDTMIAKIKPERDACVVLVGHGSKYVCNDALFRMAEILGNRQIDQYKIAALEGEPRLDTIIPEIAARYKKVILVPLTLTAGVHVHRDLAGTGEKSWKTILENSGLRVECYDKGIAEIEEIQNIFVACLLDTKKI